MRLLWVLDCADPEALAGFWGPALGYRPGRFHPPYLRLRGPHGRWPDLLLQRVLEPKLAKNRMHLDIQVTELGPTLERLRGLGAMVLVEAHDDAGYLTTVLADPEGNELCLIVPPAGSHDWRQLTDDPV